MFPYSIPGAAIQLLKNLAITVLDVGKER